MLTISCSAAHGSGGLGRHLAELVSEHRAASRLQRYFTRGAPPADQLAEIVQTPFTGLLLKLPLIRSSQGRSQFLVMDRFDAAVAERLVTPVQTHIGFCGQALRTFHRARKLGYERLELVAPTCHLDDVARQHEIAHQAYPLEDGWLNDAHRRKGLAEYDVADQIHVVSEYARQSFLRCGVSGSKLVRTHLGGAEVTRRTPRRDDGLFRFVYVGMLTVTKGVPLLLDAFAALRQQDIELVLVGGTGSRGMRRFMAEAMQRDSRIKLAPGDPTPIYERSDCCVHPSYQDGFAFAVADALATGLPAIVTEDTGAKELIRTKDNGLIIPTGDLEALVRAMTEIYKARRRS
jgi:glycosyltransferase involved in cell wall biosynthesis